MAYGSQDAFPSRGAGNAEVIRQRMLPSSGFVLVSPFLQNGFTFIIYIHSIHAVTMMKGYLMLDLLYLTILVATFWLFARYVTFADRI